MNIQSMWLPIIASAVMVWIMSALIWTVLPWHKKDFAKTGDEEAVRAALKGLQPGTYSLPHCADHSAFNDPDMQRKMEEGPQAFITVIPSGLPKMGGKMALSFVNSLVVGMLCAYMVTRTLGADAEYLAVFRISGTVAFIAYGYAFVMDSVWFGRPWGHTAKSMFDALLYGLLTGGAFGWLA
jgi:hypothetical protein